MPGFTRMGYEAQLFTGTAGTTAANQILNATDIEYNVEVERGDTTIRGDGTAPPINTNRVTARKPTITWTMLDKPADTLLQALLAAAYTGAAVALRTKDRPSGKGFDGDVTVSVKQGSPIKGEATYDFDAEATDDAGRSPSLWV